MYIKVERVHAQNGTPCTTDAGWCARSQDHVAVLIFTISDSATGQVQPGLYQVTFDGARIGVRGPWVLTWELPGP